jgi:hypothetical protein
VGRTPASSFLTGATERPERKEDGLKTKMAGVFRHPPFQIKELTD